MMLSKTNRRVFISAIIVGFGFLVSKVTGFIDDRILVQTIGLNPALDAYYAASLLPDLLFTLVSGGALATALIPMLSGFLARDDRAGAWKLTSAVVNTAFVIALGGASVMAIFAPWLAEQTVAQGFTLENQQLTANLMRVLLVGTIVFSVSGVVMSALQANQHFFLPALAPIVYNLGILGGVIFLAPRLGVWGPVIGMVIGALLHLLIQVPGLIKYRARWTAWLGWRDATLRRVIRLMIPRVIQLGVVQVASLVATSIASTAPIGSVTALSNGWKVMQVPETLIATAIATAAFPTLSELASRGQMQQLRNMLRTTLLAILAMTIPATIGLLLFGTQVVNFLYDASPGVMALITWAVHGYALGLIGHSMLEVGARTFYAQQDTRTPLLVAVGAMTIGIVASLILRDVLGVGGLALANSIGVTVEVSALLILLRRRLIPVTHPQPQTVEA
ncbi:MAG: murein biosynthesis integral membrane protein MurJ [Chloroflexi bacterium]|nr:murein biosynthesis integral membrane protein MurJ [Chloroflexota bacterium]